jgi:transcriptional regulator with XRE-family HTH domain
MLQRKKLSMTQTDLAHKSGVGYATISRIENDRGPRPNRATLIALSYALEIDPEELLSYLRGGE